MIGYKKTKPKKSLVKAEFDYKKGELIWDINYTNKRQQKIKMLMRKYEEEQSKKKN